MKASKYTPENVKKLSDCITVDDYISYYYTAGRRELNARKKHIGRPQFNSQRKELEAITALLA